MITSAPEPGARVVHIGDVTARCYATFNYGRRWEPPRLSALYGH